MRSRDPTKTTALRRSLARTAVNRVDKWRAHLRQFVVEQRALFVDPSHATSVNTAQMLKVFNDYAYRIGYQIVVGDAEWIATYAERAYVSGRNAMSDLLKRERPIITGAAHQTVETELTLARAEVEGIVDATLQGLARVATEMLRKHKSPVVTWHAMLPIINKVAVRRIKQFAQVTVVKLHHLGRLEEARRARITKFGVEVETNPKKLTGDSCGCGNLRRHYDARRGRRKRAVKRVMVEFVTAGDELVCQECEDLEGNVYTYTEAIGIIPVHPSCRCAVVPLGEGPDDSGD